MVLHPDGRIEVGGRPIEGLTRDEIIAALREAAKPLLGGRR